MAKLAAALARHSLIIRVVSTMCLHLFIKNTSDSLVQANLTRKHELLARHRPTPLGSAGGSPAKNLS